MEIIVAVLRWVYVVSSILFPIGLVLGVLGLMRMGVKGDENKKKSGRKFLLIAALIIVLFLTVGILSNILQK